MPCCRLGHRSIGPCIRLPWRNSIGVGRPRGLRPWRIDRRPGRRRSGWTRWIATSASNRWGRSVACPRRSRRLRWRCGASENLPTHGAFVVGFFEHPAAVWTRLHGLKMLAQLGNNPRLNNQILRWNCRKEGPCARLQATTKKARAARLQGRAYPKLHSEPDRWPQGLPQPIRRRL